MTKELVPNLLTRCQLAIAISLGNMNIASRGLMVWYDVVALEKDISATYRFRKHRKPSL